VKGVLAPDHIPRNKYQLRVRGLPPITFTFVGGLEEELETVDLPDRTTASGGNTKPVTFTVRMPTHHVTERVAMENWFTECQDPVPRSYKKVGTLIKQSISSLASVTYMLHGLYISKRTTQDQEMENEGELDEIEWEMKADRLIPR
jgi:hypothetical protein